MFRAKQHLWKSHPKVTLCCATPSQGLAPARPGSQRGDWMGITYGARVASPKEGADTFHCHLLLSPSTVTFC